ncbi:hypothetical protein D3C78_1112050 [compost metagenome]
MDVRPEDLLQPIGDAAGRSANAAGQVDEQRMRGIDAAPGFRQLLGQVRGCGRVAEE